MSVPVRIAPDAPDAVTLGILRASRPEELVKAATAVANSLAAIVEDKKLYSAISGKRFVRCEGWTTLAAMLGCLPREASMTRRDDGSYEAVVELVRMASGEMLTRASAECGAGEPMWLERPDYARRSMAATRATSKVCRMAFSWVMVLAGFEATPEEEIPREMGRQGSAPNSGNVIRWPFGAKKGTPLVQLSNDELKAALAWIAKTDKGQDLAEPIKDLLEERRQASEQTKEAV